MLLAALTLAGLILVGVAWSAYSALSRKRADGQADALLRLLLTPDEFVCLRSRGHLDVRSRSNPERVYRIPADPGLVAVIDHGMTVTRLCSQPVRSIPAAEHVVVHKLLLEGAEAEYWQSANQLTRYVLRWQAGEGQVALWTDRPPGVLGQR